MNSPHAKLRLLPVYLAGLALVAAACGGTGDSASEVSATTDPGPAPPTSVRPAGDPALQIQFATFAGETTNLDAFHGKPIVLNFWASWCPSCVAEMSAAFRPVADDLGDELTFIGMNIQDERALADELLAETGVQWVSAEDPEGELYIALGGIAMPFTVYISAAGEVVKKHNGPLTEGQLRAQIAESLS